MIAYLCLVEPEDQERLLTYAASLEEGGDSEKSHKVRNAALAVSGILLGGAAIAGVGGAAYMLHKKRKRKAKNAAEGVEEDPAEEEAAAEEAAAE